MTDYAPDYVTPLTAEDYAALTSGRNVVVRHGEASLAMRHVHRHGDTPEQRFVMVGPSGEHSLLVIATDLARLNAHWIAFAARNEAMAAVTA